MAFDANGQWKPEDDSVATRVGGLLSQDSPLMQQAATMGAQSANKRGLLNSSMGVQAGQQALYSAALPIASQDAQQTAQKNVQQMQIGSSEKLGFANIAAHDREKAAGLTAALSNSYGEMYRTVASAADIPADVRDRYLQHIALIRDSNMSLVEQMYNIDLDWASPSTGSAA